VKRHITGLVWSGLVWSGLVWSGLVWSGLVWSGLVLVLVLVLVLAPVLAPVWARRSLRVPTPPPYACPVATRTPTRRLVLASASPARLRLLRDAGFDPEVIVSGFDEDAVEAGDTPALVVALAEHKARAVAPQAGDALVIGCDSLLELDGIRRGKPSSDGEATNWLRAARGRTGTLFTGHCVIDTAAGREVSDVAATTVRFGHATDDELTAYVATGEARQVAGAFTLDGRSAPFMDGIDGDPGTVIGLSLPLFRVLLGRLDVAVTDLWA